MSAAQTAAPTPVYSPQVARLGRLAVRVDRRSTWVCVVLLAIACGTGVVALAGGEFPLTIRQVVGALTGTETELAQTVVLQWRLPRVVTAIVFGAALGASGAVFQSLTNNPLGSPDIVGLNTGAYTGALVVIVLLGGSFALVAGGALVGGLVTTLAVYLLAGRGGGAAGLRLIIVGIGVGATLTAVNHWIILRADLETAMSAAVWGAGSLNGVRWEQAVPAIAVLLPVLALTALAAGHMRMLELGDDAALALGVRVERTRLALLVLSVTLTAGATAVAGPIAFVSLAAPQLAIRLTRSAGMAILPAACMGAALLVAADLAAQRAFAPTQVPVGVMTVSAGGIYLIWLLIREARR
ncbi:iron complex transport system permease protein [Kineosphaera limosa]|uniref:Putative ABC transporter permease protein n=1 Tax=Kineosphaera limosa NBRC 100340 TaxID=1184609 RepID=K6WP70_9MICO|nr:iron chelate uptake ABC transporter family permease subunit [Kineosphaera limosa]NYD99666.1 iron complex transport system permease protein [Kineosphaera limosa]GAB95621.1 putative ABC transporter permease protein [Kineosphaera limosa NBRC 100340]